jgi:hypothetical protein
MNLLDLIASVTASIAWPAAAAFVVFFLRDEVRGLLRSLRITRLKMKDFEAEFVESVSQVEKELAGPKESQILIDVPISDRSLKLLDADPNYAVLDAWKEIESKIRDVSVSKLDNARNMPISRHIMALVKAELLPTEIGYALQELSAARNQIVHESEFKLNKATALRFLDLAADFAGVVSKIM